MEKKLGTSHEGGVFGSQQWFASAIVQRSYRSL